MQAMLVRDHADWSFGDHSTSTLPVWLRIWREVPGTLVAVVTESDAQAYEPGSAFENPVRVLRQLETEHPGQAIEYIYNTRYPQLDFDTFEHVFDVKDDGSHRGQLLRTNEVLDRLAAWDIYRLYVPGCLVFSDYPEDLEW